MNPGTRSKASSFTRCVAVWAWVAMGLVAIAGAGCSSSGTTCPAGQTACGSVWCYSGPFAGTVQITQGYACPCPLLQLDNWY